MTTVMTVVTDTNRRRPRAELAAAIYQAAIALFKKRGYAATTVEEIAAAAGVAKGTFFNFYPTKLDVLKAYYRTIDFEVARRRAALDPAEPRKSLTKYAGDVERILLREGPLMLELLDIAVSDPAMRRIDADSGSIDADEFADFVRRAQSGKRISKKIDASIAAGAIIDLWSGAIRTWLVAPKKGTLADLFDARMAVLFQGLDDRK